MLDRTLALIGLGLAVVAFIAPCRWPQLPSYISDAGLAIGCLICGVGIGLYFGENVTPVVEPKNVQLTLHFPGGDTTPREISETNIKQWFAVHSAHLVMKADTGQILAEVPPSWSIFILFESYPKPRQLHFDTSGAGFGEIKVVEYNATFAIIYITHEGANSGNLNIYGKL
jgi:hypothetical protein